MISMKTGLGTRQSSSRADWHPSCPLASQESTITHKYFLSRPSLHPPWGVSPSSSFLLIVRLLVLVGTPGSKWRGGWPVKQAPERVLLLWLLSEQIRIVITWHSSPSHNPRTSLAGSARVFSSISNQYISSYLIVMIWLAYIRVQ